MSKGVKYKNEKRLEILKTYKIYIGGKFPRTESGRYYNPLDSKGNILGNICLSSRKDFRNAVVAARSASVGWSARTAFNRSQILYRLGEILEGRRAQFIEELKIQGSTSAKAEKEVNNSIDRLIYYAGWCDKYQQIFSSVNPVSSSYYNFSVCEPMGVVAIIAPEENSLIGLVSVIAPVVAGGNTCVVLASESKPLCSVTFAEVINSSDVPGGVINILTGNAKELAGHFSSHMDVNAIIYSRTDKEELKNIQINASENMKRVFYWKSDWFSVKAQNPYKIRDLQEIKTTWHPIEQIGGAGSGY
ncbi:MAG: aldehyde dehydrogenase family protein [Lentimicrobiaceae bacterium]|jgi:acyl-CoA reductase-like NAD-dependent aldehyde dehydrogenase|nr:aldehyde dehydrogenase family protein [Lentimicrobiaceae bacterium]MCP4911293.1 aldehyde dehydrogenase [Bacteroidota bacterium]MBT3454024.1 aldehyde dehydrogenase family protein [Lentimicrobiaceae bacterium]MBT3819142.1 aldehyde dehydrogenase family protein [Lentimicrobiaceae bacterium]MBT4060570.1 aldehyde dehydrogenase family protein [Lentimicrobiaceae bacterium]